MKIKDYSIIETKLIEDLFTVCNAVNNGDTDFKALRQTINRLKIQPLIPIVENAFDMGKWSEQNSYITPPGLNRKQEYIDTTIIE